MDRGEAWDQYTAGGGVIEETAWEEAWSLGERLYQQGATIADLEPEAILVPAYFTPVDIDYAGEFHLTAEVEYFDKSTQSWETKFVSTNLDEAATMQDWEEAIKQAVKDTEVSPNVDWKQDFYFLEFVAERRL